MSGNPLFTMWVHPRRTFRRILDTDPKRHVLLLAALSGLAQNLPNFFDPAFDRFFQIGVQIALILVAAPLLGIVGLYLSGWLLKVIGSWLEGSGTQQMLRAATAWASVPILYTIPLWLLLLAVAPGDFMDPRVMTPDRAGLMLIVGLIQLTVAIWSVVLHCHTIGEAHGFSAWKGLLVIVLMLVIIVVAAMMLAVFGVAIAMIFMA